MCTISAIFKYVSQIVKKKQTSPKGKCAKDVNRQFTNEMEVTIRKSTSLEIKNKQTKIRHHSSRHHSSTYKMHRIKKYDCVQ